MFSSTPLHAWLLAPVLQSGSCVPPWPGGCCSGATLTCSIPTFHRSVCKILFHLVFCSFPFPMLLFLTISLIDKDSSLFFLQWGSGWCQIPELEHFFSWTLSWCFLRLCWCCLSHALALIFSQGRGCSVAFQTQWMVRCWELYTQIKWPEFIVALLMCSKDLHR